MPGDPVAQIGKTDHVAHGGWPGPLAGTGPPVSIVTCQLVVTAVSSTTNDVCSDESSVPVNFSVTV